VEVSVTLRGSPQPLRHLAVAVAGAAATLCGAITAGAADAVAPHVRSSHAYIRAMIDEAVERSATFRRLVESIETTDGIVYVEQGTCGHHVRACLALHATPAGAYRILRVLVDARQPDWDVMASIGHELRHAIEVLGNVTLKSSEAIYLFYIREGSMTGDSFETEEAIKAGHAVRNEVGSYARRKM
jgi:hypothetical protein